MLYYTILYDTRYFTTTYEPRSVTEPQRSGSLSQPSKLLILIKTTTYRHIDVCIDRARAFGRPAPSAEPGAGRPYGGRGIYYVQIHVLQLLFATLV